MNLPGTIAAVASSAIRSAISVVRISGKDAFSIADKVFTGISGKKLSACPGFTARLGKICDNKNKEIDEVIATVYRAPKSYTGEDSVEFSCHGGEFIVKRILEAVINAGAGIAQPGEFTRRAVMSGKLTLTQAEAVNEMICAQNDSAHKAALSQYDGALLRRINSIKTKLARLSAEITADLEFPEDDIDRTDISVKIEKLHTIKSQLEETIASYDQGAVLRKGVPAVIAGKPNVGKSTLMNLITQKNKSIITEYAGTTRDIIEETVDIGGLLLNIADTAGIRETGDDIEKIGVGLARKRISDSQLVIAVFDVSEPLDSEDFDFAAKLDKTRTLAVFNKSDLAPQAKITRLEFEHHIYMSAANAESPDELYRKISEMVVDREFDPDSGIIFSLRQLECAKRASVSAAEAVFALESGLEDAAAVCTETAAAALMELTGERITETILDEIFSKFCIGK